MNREFVDWSRPLLPQAAAWLIELVGVKNEVADCSRMLCVTPGRRSGRTLLQELVRISDEQGVGLLPPTIVTPGNLPEHLLENPEHLLPASDLECRLAWMQVLQQAGRESLAPLVPTLPDIDATEEWMMLSRLLCDVVRDLSSMGRTAEDAQQVAVRLAGESESARWSSIHELHEGVRVRLREGGLFDVSDPVVWGSAHLDEKAAEFTDHVVLIGITEFFERQRHAIELAGELVTALIHAPAAMGDRFHADGTIITERWTDETISLPEENIHIADRPGDQAQSALQVIAQWVPEGIAAEDMTIGLGDPAIGTTLAIAGKRVGLDIRPPELVMARQSAPATLLSMIAALVREPRFHALADLVRHADFLRYASQSDAGSDASVIEGIGEWQTLLDRYFADHLQQRFAGEWLGEHDRRESLKRVHDMAVHLANPITGVRRPLGAWFGPIIEVLQSVYGSTVVRGHDDATELLRRSIESVLQVLSDWERVPAILQPTLSGPEAIALLLEALADVSIPADAGTGQIEAVGWLELHHDPAPFLVLLGMNEGQIPASTTADPFLPDQVRDALGLPCNRTRFARDVYMFRAMHEQRRSVHCVVGKQNLQGDPLSPSRLLMSCGLKDLPRRVRHLTMLAPSDARQFPAGIPQPGELSEFKIPSPTAVPEFDSIRVTAFRSYLQCPYRFWLAHIVRLEPLSDDIDEMDPMRFGTLAHRVLQEFGQIPELGRSTELDVVQGALRVMLERAAREQFGTHPLPAVRVQLARMQRRLEGFAHRQVERAREGWHIEQVEFNLPNDAMIDIPGAAAVRVRGRIDRIDRHQDGRIALIDYKTSDTVRDPVKVHRDSSGNWIDLQLPLYIALYRQTGGLAEDAEIRAEYALLPSKPKEGAFVAGEFSDQDIDDAVEMAREIVRRIRAGEFPMKHVDPRYDPFANICQSMAFRDEDDEFDSEGAGE